MTIPKIYGSFVKNLPVSVKSKNWLMRNWLGGLIGLIIGIYYVYTITGELLGIFVITPDWRAYLLVGIVGYLFGMIIQSLLRRLKK